MHTNIYIHTYTSARNILKPQMLVPPDSECPSAGLSSTAPRSDHTDTAATARPRPRLLLQTQWQQQKAEEETGLGAGWQQRLGRAGEQRAMRGGEHAPVLPAGPAACSGDTPLLH